METKRRETTTSGEPVETASKPPLEVIDGYLVDEAGEIVGLADDQETGESRERFEIRSDEGADWVLKMMMEEEARIAAIEAKRSAILANLDGQLVEPRNRLKYLMFRFRNELERYARQELKARRGGIKTLKLVFGSIAFRLSRGSSEIIDMPKALEYVEEWKPDAVKRTVGVEAVKAAIKAEQEAEQTPDVAAFFTTKEPREEVYIKTGMGKEPK